MEVKIPRRVAPLPLEKGEKFVTLPSPLPSREGKIHFSRALVLGLCYNNIMTIKQSLIWATKILKKSKNSSPALDAEILLSFTIKKPKEFLYAHSEKKLATGQFNKFKNLIARRAKHEPVAYIISHKFFYGVDFFVDKNVLIPRPETETLVETAIDKNPTSIVDVGTGSGAIAITLAKNLPDTKIFATEFSPGAIKLARKNILHYKVAVTLLHGNLLKPFLKKYKISGLKSLLIVANLPYLTTRQWQKTQPEIKKYEPQQALDGGKDGLKYYRELLGQLKKLKVSSLKFQVSCLFEIDPSQAEPITKLIHQYFGKSPPSRLRGLLRFCDIKKDLAGRDRVVIIKIKN